MPVEDIGHLILEAQLQLLQPYFLDLLLLGKMGPRLHLLHLTFVARMLIGQAAAAFEKFFGTPPPREPGDADLRELLAP